MNLRLQLNCILLCVIPAASQYLVDTMLNITYIRSMTMIDDELYLNSRDSGNAGSVSVVKSGVKTKLWPGNYSENGPLNFTKMNGYVYYCFNDMSTKNPGPFYNSLWRTDGVSVCQKIVNERVGEPVAIGNDLYFRKHDPLTGYELWKYNEVTGLELVTNIAADSDDSYPTRITVFKNKLFFHAFNPTYGFELWTSDGTAAGTFLLKDIWPGPRESVQSYAMIIDGIQFDYLEPVYKFTECNGYLYFLADDSVHGMELWRTDGTTSGTTMVKDIVVGKGAAFNKIKWQAAPLFCAFNNELYFIPDYGPNGKELWKTDGTEAGTYMLKDINPGAADAGITELEVNNGYLYFDADDGTNGKELWRTDGTTEGTVMFMDFQPQIDIAVSSNPRDLTTHVDGKLYFVYKYTEMDTFCDDFGVCVPYGIVTSSLYRTDGTVSGTEKIFDFPYDENNDSTHMLTSASKGLYFRRCDDAIERLCWLHTDAPLIFTSTPVINAITGTTYNYNISVIDPDSLPITIEATNKPSWMSFVDNGNGTALLTGTPSSTGLFNVVISAKSPSSTIPVIQSFTVEVKKESVEIFLEVYAYEEQRFNANQSNPRLYITNTGTTAVSDFKVEYYFLVEGGKTPVLERYYTGGCSVSLVNAGGGNYKLVYDFTGQTIQPGQTLPNPGGAVVGIHYTDYSLWDKTNDYSNNLSPVFIENNRICIYSKLGVLIYGIPPSSANIPPVAVAGKSFSVTDVGDDGESIMLDGSFSYDPDGTIINYEWYINGLLTAKGKTGSVILYPGVYTVCLKVTDDDGATSTDTITITVLNSASVVTFIISPDPVPSNVPVVIRYNVPAALDGATIRYTIQRKWDIISGMLTGNQGNHVYRFWEWNKYFFGGSGPWELKIEVNGLLTVVKQIRFTY